MYKDSREDFSDPSLDGLEVSCLIPQISVSLPVKWASLAAQLVKNLPAMRETWVRSLGWEDPLELENPLDCTVYGHKESDTTERLSFSLYF